MEKHPNLILIFSPKVTKRLNYIVNILFRNTLSLDFEITNEKELFETAKCPKFSYSDKNYFPENPYLKSHSLLFENKIHQIDIDILEIEGNKAFFKTCQASFFSFDIFAASFYLISRYEEYLPFRPDKYDRFSAEESLSYKEKFLEIPLVNIWTRIFCKKLCQMFPELKPINTKFRFLSTIDIDNAWAHLNKGFLRSSISLVKLLLNLNFTTFIEKINILFLNKKDPYDNYEFIDEIHKKYGYEPIYFILFSKYAKYDKNPSQKNAIFRALIRKIANKNKIGLHPSFQSNKYYKNLEIEKKVLEQLINIPIIRSGQHYLMIKMPETYENLLKTGIMHDYSMGYSSHIGFRASFCLPYRFFNLEKNEETLLEIIPFQVMDVCFKNYQKIKPEIALEQIKKVISSTKKVNGLFVSVWHNESLYDNNNRLNWRNVFELMLNESKNGN